MAWNEPGGGNQKDPWGGGDKNGPPDLDEAMRKFQERISKMMGGGGGSKQGSGGGASGMVFALVALVVLGLWFAAGVYKLDEQDRAVVLRLGKFSEIVGPGLHWNPALIDQRQVVNVTRIRSYAHSALMLTEDENIVEVSLSIQYKASDARKFALNVRDPERSLAQATESALRHVVGSTEMHLILTEGREQVAVDVKERLQRYIDNYDTGIEVTTVTIANTQAPKEVQAAFDDVIKAREDEERVKNEAQTYANGIVPEARGDAQRVIEEANGYKQQVVARAEGESQRFTALLTEYQRAPAVTRERLYIETMQELMSKSSKILMDVENGNNLLYLPLDKIIDGKPGSAKATMSESKMKDLTETLRRQAQLDNAPSRRTSNRERR
ncbi:protease FtsH subunit HflK [Sinobacterium caligoides]|uniref:Protein HflK n=1 Tax=Sinobacterium caligoides TaxID=933926 RepID=A0A3N2DG21_9GAMM|nr:FtsH protease activity modulator HflK [Sinobacterium caligoides]ROR98756.1 protease FtsH subunit HflK [Sinobacterium caligoides]